MSVFSLRAVKVYRTYLKAFKFCPTIQKILTQFLFSDILSLLSAVPVGRLSFDCLSDNLHSAFFIFPALNRSFSAVLNFFEKSVDNGIFRAMI